MKLIVYSITFGSLAVLGVLFYDAYQATKLPIEPAPPAHEPYVYQPPRVVPDSVAVRPPASAPAQPRSPSPPPRITTKPNYVACTSPENYQRFVRFATNEDRASMQSYLASGRCRLTRGGVHITLQGTSGPLWSRAHITKNGVDLWMATEGLNR